MQIRVTTAQGRVPITILALDGNLDSATYGSFEERAKNTITEGARDLLIDMTRVPYMSSAGMRALNSLVNQLHTTAELETIHQGIRDGKTKAMHLKLAGVQPKVAEVIQLTGLDMFIAMYPNTASAISSF